MPPFKLNPVNPAVAKGVRVREPGLSTIIQHAYDEGETIDEAATELKAPDHTVGSLESYDVSSSVVENHPQRPVYPEANPYPPITPVKRPFKLEGDNNG